ncbi:MAG: Diguanylate cyclase [Actinomycetota bacterium]|nr:Diguanylate cyclase [Actinomycetota bacterium]
METIPAITAFSYLGFGTLFLAMVIAWRYLPGSGDRAAIRMYLVSAALTAAGAMVDVLRYIATPAWAVAGSLVLTLLSQLTALMAARRLLRMGPTPRVFSILTVAGSVVTTWFTLVEPNYVGRSGAYLVTGAVLTGAIGWTFLRASEPGLTVIFRIIGTIYGSYAILSFVRVAMLPSMDPTSDVDQSPTSVLLNQLAALPLLFLIAVMLVMVTVRRAHDVVSEDRDVAVETSAELLAETWSDPLTGLASRARIRSVIEASLAAGPNAGPPGVLVVALDGNLAESHGHRVADEALVSVAERVTSLCGIHPQDWDTAGRWGENSIILLPPAESSRSIRQWALSLQDALTSMTTAAGHPCSASVAEIRIEPGVSMASLEVEIRDAMASALDEGPSGMASNVRA